MNGVYLATAGRIRQELTEIEQIVQRIQAIWLLSEASPHSYYLDAIADKIAPLLWATITVEMPIDFQTFVAIFAALLVFLTGVFLSYDTLELSQYRIVLPQWVGLLLATITFFTVAVDQVLRGLVRVEEVQRRAEERQRSAEAAEFRTQQTNFIAEEEQRRIREEQRRIREEQRSAEEVQRRDQERQRSAEEAERAARRARIEAGCRAGQIRYQLEPSDDHRQQLAAVLAVLEEYRQTL